MSKTGIFYWSSTGNTQAMAEAIAEGARSAGAEVDVYDVNSASPSQVKDYDALAFGCPAMGSEQLNETVFQPFFEEAASLLGGKKVGLFGSYGWGSGEWMQNWEMLCAEKNISLAVDSVIANNAPDAEALAACEAMGKALAA